MFVLLIILARSSLLTSNDSNEKRDALRRNLLCRERHKTKGLPEGSPLLKAYCRRLSFLRNRFFLFADVELDLIVGIDIDRHLATIG